MAQSKRAKVANYLCRLNFRSPLGSASAFLFTLIRLRFCRISQTSTFGLGNSVRAPSLKLHHRFDREPRLIRFARVPLCFRERLVAQHRHDLVYRASSLCQAPACCLAEPMRLTLKGEPRFGYRVPHPLAEAIDRERLPMFSVDDGQVIAIGRSQYGDQLMMVRDR